MINYDLDITYLVCFVLMRISTLVNRGNGSVFYLYSTLFCFSYNSWITLVCDVGAECSLKASRIMELNFSLKLLCCMLSQTSQVLQM